MTGKNYELTDQEWKELFAAFGGQDITLEEWRKAVNAWKFKISRFMDASYGDVIYVLQRKGDCDTPPRLFVWEMGHMTEVNAGG